MQAFDASADVSAQLVVAAAMQDEYRKNKEKLAGHGNNDALASIGLGAATASAAAFGAPIDALKGLAIITGAHAVGAGTFKGGDQLAIYRAGESAVACVAEKARKMDGAEKRTFKTADNNYSFSSAPARFHAQLNSNQSCETIEMNGATLEANARARMNQIGRAHV